MSDIEVTPTVDRNAEAKQAADVVKSEVPKKVAAKTEPKSTYTLYVSADKEKTMFEIVVAGERIKSFWDDKREHLLWRVPNGLKARFELHDFVVKQRIVKSEA